jgi:Flp pilus assembly CpaF family ATPase
MECAGGLKRDAYRIQFVLPPAAGPNVVLSIRKPAMLDMDLDDDESCHSLNK